MSLCVRGGSISTGFNQSVTGCGSQRRQCSCYSTKNSCKQHDPHPQIEFDFVVKHIHQKWSSLSTTHILMCMFLNEVKFTLRIRITIFIWVFVKWQLHVFVENHNLWQFDCTQWFPLFKNTRWYLFIYTTYITITRTFRKKPLFYCCKLKLFSKLMYHNYTLF